MRYPNWIRVNNNALAYFGGVTPTVTPDNCKVAVARNKDWISPVLNKDFQAWAEHNNTVLTPAKVKSPRWKPVVEGHVKIITMHILMDMEEMVFYSLDDLNRVLMEKVAAEIGNPLKGSLIPGMISLQQKRRRLFCPFRPTALNTWNERPLK